MTAFRRILITGTSSGLGRGFLDHYTRAGARVISANRRLDRDLAGRYPTARFEVLDIADPAAVEDLLRQLEADGDAPDLFVLNAGINQPDNVAGLDYAAYHEVMRTNLDGVMTFVGAVAKLGLVGRTIAGMSSTSNIVANPGHVAYHLSKVAIRKAFALLARNDRRNAYKSVVLGPVRTNIMARYPAPDGLQAKILSLMIVEVEPTVRACARFFASRRAVLYHPRWVCLAYLAIRTALAVIPGVYRGTVKSA